MEVSNVRDHVTHAIISGGKTIDFAISDSPEFFHILSSTLYSDQPLAVVREVLCNAWDAHIEAGCPDKPVEVTLTDEELIIRDFGPGIHDDDIGETYGVYGGSTKKKNKLVTGGFGLGCKAPFAYTDHFEVISCHAGRKTIYNLSKSSAEVNGRPGIVPIASLPSEETGLQVKIQLKNREDRYRFAELIKRIASNGEMNVLLNDEPIDVLPFSTMKHGFLVTQLPVIEGNHQGILIRYGHVVYPVENHSDYGREFKKIREFLKGLPSQLGHYKIIFQAEPDTISVTPSRESLSMQEHTINTLTSIFQNFAEFLDTRLETECLNILQESIVDVWTKMQPKELFSTSKTVPGLHRQNYGYDYSQGTLVELPEIVRTHVAWNYPEYEDFRFKDLLARTDSLVQAGFGNTGLIKSFRSELLRLHRRKRLDRNDSTWLHRKVIAPLIRDLKAAGLTDKKLTIYGKQADPYRYRYTYTDRQFTEARKFRCRPFDEYLPFLRNIVVLTHNRVDVEERVASFPIMKNWLGKSSELLCYTVPRNPQRVAQVREFFEARGVELIDLTVYHKWEDAPVPVEPKKKEEVRRRPKGLPILGSLLNNGIRMDFLAKYEDEERDIRRSTSPKLIIKLARGDIRYTIDDFSTGATDAICALWPNDIGIATTASQLSKYTEKGALPLIPWLVEQVCSEIQTNKRIQQSFAFDFNRIEGLYYHRNLKEVFDLVWSDAKLRKKFGLVNDLTPTDRHYLVLWEAISRWPHWRKRDHPEISKTEEVVKAIKLDPAVTKLHKLLESRRHILGTLETHTISRILLSDDSSKLKPFQETTRRIVLLALKG